jgi:molecular chaperone GrpE
LARKSKKQEKPEAEELATDETSQAVAEDTGAVEAEVEPLDPLAELRQELEDAQVATAQNWDLYLRERADLENFRKRAQRDKEEAIRFANDRLLKEVIPVLDNLERAVEHSSQNGTESEALLEGVNMTITMFAKVLSDFGVKPVAALGEPFDPNFHQAMGQVETDEQPVNTVVNEFQKGYLLNDRLLRPSLVMVAKAPTGESGQEEETEPTDHQ